MSEIQIPPGHDGETDTVSKFLELVTAWHAKHTIKAERFHSSVWYRGNPQVYSVPLRPGVYRDECTTRSSGMYGTDSEEKRLNLEREMLAEFRTTGALFFDANDVIGVYFLAQHHGMPTRLLDWTTNPLAALFFAVEDVAKHSKDGEVFVMDAKKILPTPPSGADAEFPQNILTMRHPHVTDAIGESFWHPSRKPRQSLVLPVKPDNQPGRIGQQSSCFTLHMHKSNPCPNPTLARFKVPAKAKTDLLGELHRMNINQFTIYNDLDHLSKDIKLTWRVSR